MKPLRDLKSGERAMLQDRVQAFKIARARFQAADAAHRVALLECEAALRSLGIDVEKLRLVIGRGELNIEIEDDEMALFDVTEEDE